MTAVDVTASPSEQAAASRRASGARRLMWLALLAVAFLLPFLSQTGRYVADTHDAVWFDPGAYATQSLRLWQPSPFLGNEQHEGNLVPMTALIGLARLTGIPVWATERLWHGLLLFVAAAGMVKLIERLRGRRGLVGPLAAALIYTLTPYTFGYGLPITSAFLPYVLLPWLVLATAWGLERPGAGLAGPVVFGLVTFMMGGGNGATQAYALVPPVAYGLWMVAVERSVPAWRALRFFAVAAVFAAGLNAYWLFLLTTKEVGNALTFSEQPRLINVSSSFSESIRGLGFWQFYGGDGFGPWVPQVRRAISSPLFAVTSFAVPLGAFVSAWLVRWRFRLFFLLLLLLAALVMTGLFPVSSPTPFGHLLQWIYAHAPAAGGLRTTYKLAGSLNLATAVLAGVGLEEAWRRGGRLRSHVAARWAVAGVAVVVIGTNAFPLWSGRLYNPARTAPGIPAYWQQALADLRSRERGYRAFFAPGALAATYRWGGLMEGMADATPTLPSIRHTALPIGQGYGSNLLAAVEQSYQTGLTSTRAAVLFRYLGVRDVALQNDVDWQRARTARPADMHTLALDPSLEALTSFGRVGQNTTASAAKAAPDIAQARLERALPPVEILTVPRPLPVVRAEGDDPVIVSGDGFGVLSAARLGLLDRNPPVLYSGNLTPAGLTTLLVQHPSFVVTDSNRRRSWSFGVVQRNYSYTLPAGPSSPRDVVDYGLFADRPATQSVALYQGVKSITASGYGSPFESEPEFRPANAFDRDPATSWQAGALVDPVGQWVQATFERPLTLSRITLSVPNPAFGRRVRQAKLEFSDGTSILAALRVGENEVAFTPRTSSFLRVRIASVTTAPVDSAVGFSEIRIPGLRFREVIRVPSDLAAIVARTPGGPEALAGASLTYIFDRLRSDSPIRTDEEDVVARRFDVPVARRFLLDGSVHLNPQASDEAIDNLIRPGTKVHAASSSRFFGNPRARASAAVDGRLDTDWVPAGTTGQWLKLTFPPRRLDHLSIQTDAFPGRTPISELRIGFSDGSSVTAPVDQSTGFAAVSFQPRVTSSVTVTVTGVVALPSSAPPPVGIAEVAVPGISLPAVGDRRRLPCTSSPEFTVDGRQIALRPVGTVGDMLDGKSLRLGTCADVPLSLGAGWHTLVAAGSLQADTLTLHAPLPSLATAGSVAPRPPPPTVRSTTSSDGGFDVKVGDATAPFYLTIGQNYSPSWAASIDGRSLGPPVVLDGYATAWRIDRTGTLRVAVRLKPQSSYELWLAVSVGFVIVSLVLLAAWAQRQRRR